MSGGFMDALNSLPQVPKRVKRKTSRNPINNVSTSSNHNNKTTEPISHTENEMPFEPEEIPEKVEPAKPQLNRFGKPMKSVSWQPEERLTSVRYFDIHENERVNVSTQSFKDAMHHEHMLERQRMKGAKFYEEISKDSTWRRPKLISLPESLIERGCNSIEKEVQKEREKSVLQSIFPTKEAVPPTPTEPDPESYEVVQPQIIPLVDENNPEEVELANNDNSKTVLGNINSNGQTDPSNVGDLKEKLKEILQTASAITPNNENGQHPQYPPPNDMNQMYMQGQVPMGMPPNGIPPIPPNFYGGPPVMMQGPPPHMDMGQNYGMPPPWQQQQYQRPPYQPHYNNNQRPPWHNNNRGRPRHTR